MNSKEKQFADEQGLIFVDSRMDTPANMNTTPQETLTKDMKITVQDIIEHVKTEICFNYCKMPDEAMAKANGDENVADKALEEICDKCPLGLL